VGYVDKLPSAVYGRACRSVRSTFGEVCHCSDAYFEHAHLCWRIKLMYNLYMRRNGLHRASALSHAICSQRMLVEVLVFAHVSRWYTTIEALWRPHVSIKAPY
jgi:hypothetical protein